MNQITTSIVINVLIIHVMGWINYIIMCNITCAHIFLIYHETSWLNNENKKITMNAGRCIYWNEAKTISIGSPYYRQSGFYKLKINIFLKYKCFFLFFFTSIIETHLTLLYWHESDIILLPIHRGITTYVQIVHQINIKDHFIQKKHILAHRRLSTMISNNSVK